MRQFLDASARQHASGRPVEIEPEQRQLEEVEPALARGTGWPFGGRGPKSRSPSGMVSKTIGVRATAEERAAWERAAGDRRLSDWIRDLLNAAAAAAAEPAASPQARTSRSRSNP